MTKFNEGDKVTLTSEGLFVASCQIESEFADLINENTIFQVDFSFDKGRRLYLDLFIDVYGVLKKATCRVLPCQVRQHLTIDVGDTNQHAEKKALVVSGKTKWHKKWTVKGGG